MNSLDIEEIISDFSRFYILTILYEGPTHGYNILSKFKRRLKKDITPSIVYPFLKQLEEKNLVTHTNRPVGNKSRKVYELTKEGKELCNQLFKRFADLVSTAIEPNLDICVSCGCKVYEGGHTEQISGRQLVFCCKHCADSYKRTNRP